MARKFAKPFYDSDQWQKARQLALIRDGGLCVLCGKPAQEVHHVIHLNEDNIGDPEVATNLDNLKCLCKDCHFQQHEIDRINARRKRDECGTEYMFDENGMIVRS